MNETNSFGSLVECEVFIASDKTVGLSKRIVLGLILNRFVFIISFSTKISAKVLLTLFDEAFLAAVFHRFISYLFTFFREADYSSLPLIFFANDSFLIP